MSKVYLNPTDLPDPNIKGEISLRYRLTTEDKNETSQWSNIRNLTLPQNTIQIGSSTSGLTMSYSSITDKVIIAESQPLFGQIPGSTFAWAPGEDSSLNVNEYDLYGYFSEVALGGTLDFRYTISNSAKRLFLGTIGLNGTFSYDPSLFPPIPMNVGGMITWREYYPTHVVFVFSKKTNTKDLYDFALTEDGTGMTNFIGTTLDWNPETESYGTNAPITITQHNLVTFVSPVYEI